MNELVDLDEFRRLLANGHGRAIVWLRQGERPGMREAVYTEATQVHQFDRFIEDQRGFYLKFALDALEDRDPLLERIATALKRSRRSPRQTQMAEVLALYSEKRPDYGDVIGRVARRNLRSGSVKTVTSWLVAQPERAFRYVLRYWSPTEDAEWFKLSALEVVEGRLGRRRVRVLVRRYRTPAAEAFRVELDPNKRAPSRPEPDVPPLEGVLSRIEEGNVPFRRHLELLTAEDVRELVNQQPDESKVDQLGSWLFTFAVVAYPGDPHDLLRWAKHRNPDLRRRGLQALGSQVGDVARKLCLRLVGRVFDGGEALDTLVNDFQAGDERLLIRELTRPRPGWARHKVVMSVLEIMREQRPSNREELARMIYESVECETCRCSAFDMLLNMGAAPVGLIEEARFDSCHFTRESAEKASRNVL